MRLHHFHGGLSLPRHKASSARQAITRCPLPAELNVPLLQHSGLSAQPCVAVGERVLAGQLLGTADSGRSANVHSPASGTVLAVADGPLPYPGSLSDLTDRSEGKSGWRQIFRSFDANSTAIQGKRTENLAQSGFSAVDQRQVRQAPSGLSAPHVRIAVDSTQREVTPLPVIDWRHAEAEPLIERAHACGLVGMGGGGFPSAQKLRVARATVILNGAECEPYITCDDRLLREYANEVVMGGRLMRRATRAGRVILALETAMSEAMAACAQAISECGENEIELIAVPTIYPAGGERQLIRVLTGDEVPRGGLPRDIGVVVHNVATARALWRAVAHGEASTRRIVSVTGPGVQRAGNWDVAVGTPISHLIAQAGGYTEVAARLIMGGPMMGVAVANDDYPISKTSNCILVLAAGQLRDPAGELPCIRCGDCARACPAYLLPQLLLGEVRGEQWPRAQQQGIFDCIECGCCDLVCPSHIPLTQHFRYGKSELRVRAREAEQADAARLRHEQRQARLSERESEREQHHDAHQAALTSATAVAAAIARAKARREAQGNDPS